VGASERSEGNHLKIGVISDTHNFLDPRVPKLFAGVQHILHGGDIGLPWLIHELEAIAPVTAVLGNTDDAGLSFRQTEVVELAARKFLVHHIVNPQALDDSIERRITRERPSVVVFGHTHKPFCDTINGTLYFNPGYAGKSRFGMERSVAIIHCDGKEIRHQYFSL
jgi:putative phosphoesterase